MPIKAKSNALGALEQNLHIAFIHERFDLNAVTESFFAWIHRRKIGSYSYSKAFIPSLSSPILTLIRSCHSIIETFDFIQ